MTNAVQNKQNRLFSASSCSYQESKEHNYIFEREPQDSCCASKLSGASECVRASHNYY